MLLALSVFASGCATPVAISTASPRTTHRYLTQSALSADEPSTFSEIELRRYDLLEPFADDPDAALAQLHELALEQGLPAEALFALAELSFLRAEESHDPGRFGAAALYAWAFLFPEEPREPLDPLDPRSRVAADLYNRALASAFQREPGGAVVPREGGLALPFGHFTAQPGTPPDLGGYAIARLDPVAELVVIGLRNRYRRPGIGAPLAATLAPTPASAAQPVPMTPSTHLPLTAVIDVERPLAQIRSGQVTGRLELLPTLEVDTIEIGGRSVALEAEPTAALAAGLTESRFWQQELRAFFGDSGRRERSGGDLRAAPLPRRPHPRGVRARHRLEPRALGRHGERPDRGQAAAPPLRVLVLPLRLGQPHPVLGVAAPPGAHASGGARGSGRRGPLPARHGGDRATARVGSSPR